MDSKKPATVIIRKPEGSLDIPHDMEWIKANFDRVCTRKLLAKQKLTAEFCAKYILYNEDATGEDLYITFYDVLKRQPHITEEELEAECAKCAK